MTAPACPVCGIVVKYADVVPDGAYCYGSINLASWQCACGTNRAARFSDIPQDLRRAALLADLSRDSGNEMEG